jgi:hypothetical protein
MRVALKMNSRLGDEIAGRRRSRYRHHLQRNSRRRHQSGDADCRSAAAGDGAGTSAREEEDSGLQGGAGFCDPLPEPILGIRKRIDALCQFRRIAITPDIETNFSKALRGFARSGTGVTMLHLAYIRGLEQTALGVHGAGASILTIESTLARMIDTRRTYHVSTQGRFLPEWRGGVGADLRPLVIQCRVSTGSMTWSISSTEAILIALPFS